jgi:hypothetical protein
MPTTANTISTMLINDTGNPFSSGGVGVGVGVGLGVAAWYTKVLRFDVLNHNFVTILMFFVGTIRRRMMGTTHLYYGQYCDGEDTHRFIDAMEVKPK